MAFPLPDHLPRAGFSQEGAGFGSTSSHAEPYLKKIAATSQKEFNVALARKWLKDLDGAVLETKERISSRIQSNLPVFEQQLESARQVQSRLKSLSASVEDLDDSLNGAESGILPAVLKGLHEHSTLAQQTSDANITETAVSHLLKCRNEYRTLSKLADDCNLPEAMSHCDVVKRLLDSVPEPLGQAAVVLDVKRRFRALVDRIQEQLGTASDSGLRVESSNGSASLRVLSTVDVGGAQGTLELASILAALSSDALGTRLTSLRKDLISKLVVPLLYQGAFSLDRTANEDTYRVVFGTQGDDEPLQALLQLLQLIHARLIPALPSQHSSAFRISLYAPLTDAILNHYLKPAIPSSLSQLPAFIHTVQSAVDLEAKMVKEMGIRSGSGTVVSEWAKDVGIHYEKKRRESVVAAVRDIIEDPAGDETGVGVRVEEVVAGGHAGSGSEDESVASSSIFVDASQTDDEGSAWDFDDTPGAGPSTADSTEPQPPETPADPSIEEEGWGFDDDLELPTSPPPPPPPPPAQASSEAEGWDWDENPPQTPQLPPPDSASAKPARGLERFAAPRHTPGGQSTSSGHSANAPSHIPVPTISAPPKGAKIPKIQRSPETYLVSPSASKVLEVAKQTLAESKQLAASSLLSDPRRGELLVTTTSAIFDLFRALYPVAHADALQPGNATFSSGDVVRLSNDCKYLSQEVALLAKQMESEPGRAKLLDTERRLKAAGETWLDSAVGQQMDAIGSHLAKTNGFIEIGDEDQFEVYREAMEEVYQEIESAGRSWKLSLTRTSYLEATGSLVDETLSRVIEETTSLPDIPEVESHRLNEMFKILNPLEDLFIDGDQSNVVTHVPLWLKFSYLAELLEASMTDISYLFDEGALIDFTVEELVRLVRALFADTALRARTIEKISQGHPM